MFFRSWTFKTKYYDIGFSIVHRPFENDDVAAPKETIKVEYKRLNSQKSVQSGSLICDASGHCEFCIYEVFVATFI